MKAKTPPQKLVRFFRNAACMLACAFAGCQPSAPDDRGIVELNFWNGFSGPDGKAMEQMVRKFNEEHAGRVRVRMQIIPWGTFYDKVTLSLAFGGAPDVFVLHVNRFPEYASHGVLGSLDGLNDLDKNDFVPAPWEATFWNAKQYALPLDCHPLGLYYNTELFRKAGIAKPPETFDQFVDAAKRLTKDADGDGDPDQWGFAYTWLHSNSYLFLNQYGTTILTPDLKRSALNEPAAKRAMDRMLQIIDSGVAPRPEGQDAWLGFQTGKVAMAMEGVYMMAGLQTQKDLKWAAAPVPQFGDRKAVWAGSHLLTMPASLTGKRREAAWTFMRYLSDNSLIWAAGGQVPVRRHLLDSPEFRKMEVQYQFSRQLPYVVYEPKSVNYNLVATFGDSAVEGILNKTQKPEEALSTASRRIDNVLARQ